MAEDKKQIALQANEEEVRLIELIKEHHHRKSDSDMIRFLINQEAEKILNKNSGTIIIKR